MSFPLEEIEKAFSGVLRPKNLTLHVAEEHDNRDYENDEIHRKKDFDGRWQDIPDEHLLRCPYGLTHLASDGLPFYLPAAMTWVLKNFKDVDSYLVDATIYQFASSRKNKDLVDHYNNRFRLFNLDQWIACRTFLKHLLSEDPGGALIDSKVAKEALEDINKTIKMQNKMLR